MRNFQVVLMALKSGETKTMDQLKTEIPDLQVQFMHKYIARAKYLAGAEIELMKAGQVIKTARARDADTLRLVNADKFKSYNPETKTGGSLHRKANPKVKASKPVKSAKPTKAPVKAKPVKAPNPAKVKAPKPVKVKDVQPAHGAAVVEMIRAELAATAPEKPVKPVKKAAALPRGPIVDIPPVKIERVTNEVTPLKDPDDLLEIPEFLQIKRSTKLAEE